VCVLLPLLLSNEPVGVIAAGTLVACDRLIASVFTLALATLCCGVFTRTVGNLLWRRSSGLDAAVLNSLIDRCWDGCVKARSEGRAVCMGEVGRIVAVSRAIPDPEQRFVAWVELCCHLRVSLETTCDLLGPRRGGSVSARDIVM
jgi:hypothetical protein